MDATLPCRTCGAVPIHWLLTRIGVVEVYGLCNACVALLLVVRQDEGTDELTLPT